MTRYNFKRFYEAAKIGDLVLVSRKTGLVLGPATVVEKERKVFRVEFDEGNKYHPKYRTWGIKDFFHLSEYKFTSLEPSEPVPGSRPCGQHIRNPNELTASPSCERFV